MGYEDPEFAKNYEEYLQEAAVRKSHDFAFSVFRRMVNGLAEGAKVLDLGCGVSEFSRYGHIATKNYVGIDLHDTGKVSSFLEGDYTDEKTLNRVPFDPNVVVSLFSTEVMLSQGKRYAYYDMLFRSFAGLRLALVAGFYYLHKVDQPLIIENLGGVELQSYQSIEHQSEVFSELFTEMRFELATPSRFGKDVREIWKILVRK
jgi:hypothetical protein